MFDGQGVVPSPASDDADDVVGNTFAVSAVVAETISRHVWCITVADNGTGATPDSTPSAWRFKNTRYRRFAATGRDTTPDIRACVDAAAAVTTVTYHGADSATDGSRVTPTAAACIKGEVSIADTASSRHIDDCVDPSHDTATAASYLFIRQATRRVIAKFVAAPTAAPTTAAAATAVAAADSWPSLDGIPRRRQLS